MRQLLIVPFVVFSLSMGAEANTGFDVPLCSHSECPSTFNPDGTPLPQHMDLEDGRVYLGWNGAFSVPVVAEIHIYEAGGDRPPLVLSRAGTEAEVRASARAFIDKYPQLFGVSSGNLLDVRVVGGGGEGWIFTANQIHKGSKLLFGLIELFATTEGRLVRLDARLVPVVDLEGLGVETSVSAERALEIALSYQDYLAPTPSDPPPEKVVAFRGGWSRPPEAFMAWQVILGEGVDWGGYLGPRQYLIGGSTGEILSVEELLTSAVSRPFIRGDANSDKIIDITDSTAILSTLFLGAEGFGCPDAADVNDDGRLDISDPVYALEYLFLGGAVPPEPFPSPGPDNTSDGLDCPPPASDRS